MNIVGVTGHQNIPEEAAEYIKTAIIETLSTFGEAFTGVSALAAGADQVFAQTVLEYGGNLHAVIPCNGYEATFENRRDLELFQRLLAKASSREVLEHDQPSETAFLEAGYRVIDLSNMLVAVWDGQKSKGKGGTADAVQYAQQQGKEIIVIWPSGVDR